MLVRGEQSSNVFKLPPPALGGPESILERHLRMLASILERPQMTPEEPCEHP